VTPEEAWAYLEHDRELAHRHPVDDLRALAGQRWVDRLPLVVTSPAVPTDAALLVQDGHVVGRLTVD
jgi:hypothetical protein